MITIESERLILRPWVESDFDIFASIMADPKVARFIGGTCNRVTAWRKWATIIGHWTIRGYGFWALEEKATGDFVGSSGIWFPEGWLDIELGYWLLPEKQGKGYATEATRRAREYAYEKLDPQRLVSYIDPANQASIAVVTRLGATLEETIDLAGFGDHRVYLHPRV